MSKLETTTKPERPLKYQIVSKKKKEEQAARIPKEWLISNLTSPDVTNYIDLPRKCGLLSSEELRITEQFDATALAEEIREKRLKCVDVVRAFCKRATIAHQLTNCLTEIFFTDALERAAELDAHLASGKPPLGPLHGVPVSLKDTFKVRGYDSSTGLASLAFNPVTQNSVLVDILLNSGAVLYCKTNVPQTLLAFDTHNNVFGRTINPHNTAVTAGGSSGGEGALIAMRGSVLGVGSDLGGSIRIPAMCNGIFSIKPSWERIPYANGIHAGAMKVSIPPSAGPMGRSMRDMELFFRAVSLQEPWTLDPDVTPLPWNILPATSPPRKLRIGIVRHDGIVTPHPPISRLLDTVKTALTSAGVETIALDIAPLLTQCKPLFDTLHTVEGGNAMLDLIEAADEPLSPWLQSRFQRQPPKDLLEVQKLHAKRDVLQKEFLQVWNSQHGDVDAFFCPVAPHPVPPVDRYDFINYTSAFVLLDCAAGVVPVKMFGEQDLRGEVEGEVLGEWDRVNRGLWTGFDRRVYLGTPLCVQVVAPSLREEVLVEAMQVIDEAVKMAGCGKVGAKL